MIGLIMLIGVCVCAYFVKDAQSLEFSDEDWAKYNESMKKQKKEKNVD